MWQKEIFLWKEKKYGLNMQAACDANRKFLNVSIFHPGSTSDYLAFQTSSLKHKLEKDGFLAPGLCLYCDNAYTNSLYMATPYKNVSEGAKDASTLSVPLECWLTDLAFFVNPFHQVYQFPRLQHS